MASLIGPDPIADRDRALHRTVRPGHGLVDGLVGGVDLQGQVGGEVDLKDAIVTRGVDDRVAAEHVGLGDLERIGPLVPGLEAGILVVDEAYGQFADWCARTASCVLHDRDARALLA